MSRESTSRPNWSVPSRCASDAGASVSTRLVLVGEYGASPMKEGWITGSATAVGAFIPVARLLVSTEPWAVWTSFGVSMLSHFAVGAARSLFTGRSVFRSGMDMFLVGLGVAVVGYFIGEYMVKLL